MNGDSESEEGECRHLCQFKTTGEQKRENLLNAAIYIQPETGENGLKIENKL